MTDVCPNFPITIDGTTIYAIDLPAITDRSLKRRAETKAVSRLVDKATNGKMQLTHNADGSPRLLPLDDAGTPTPHISISHGAGMVVVAINQSKRIGIDIETQRDQLPRIAKKFLNKDEREFYIGNIEKLLLAWTAKEAIFKALGIPGLTISQITLPSDLQAESVEIAGHRLRIRSISWSNITLTIARLV